MVKFWCFSNIIGLVNLVPVLWTARRLVEMKPVVNGAR